MKEQFQVLAKVDEIDGVGLMMNVARVLDRKESYPSYEMATDAKKRFLKTDFHTKEVKIRKRLVTDWEEVE